MDAEELTHRLNWGRPIRRLWGGSRLLKDAQVFVDFEWEPTIGHPHRTFTNYLSLAKYIKRSTRPGGKVVLLLSTDAAVVEGRYPPGDDAEIFVVNVQRYRAIANNDAAGAYFAGLSASPIVGWIQVRASGLDEPQLRLLMDELLNHGKIASWLTANADGEARLRAVLDAAPPNLDSIPTDRLSRELLTRLADLDDEDLAAVEALVAAEDFPSGALHSGLLARRRLQVATFDQHLSLDDWSEREWQDFFNEARWIFGHGLLYQFVDVLQREVRVGGADLSGRGGQVADFGLLTQSSLASFIVLVDIKTPSCKLVVPSTYRNGAHAPHGELAGALAQAIANCDEWNRNGSLQESNRSRAQAEGWTTVLPRTILVAGNSQTLTSDGMRRSFELLRRHLHGIEILTFDELLVRARSLVADDEGLRSRTSDPAGLDRK